MNAVILARVSSKEQEEGHSIDAQIDRLHEYAKKKSLTVLNVFRIIESSTRGDRKEFHEMIEFAKTQGETVAIVCDAVDRFQRSFKETVLLDESRLKGTIELHFYREGLVINRESSGVQMLMWNMAVLMANSYVLSLGDNVKRSINHKIKNGEWIGKAPIGYRNDRDVGTGKKKIVIDKENGFLVRQLFEEYSQGGRSIREMVSVAKTMGLTGEGGKKLGSSHVHFLLSNPFYYGSMRIKGNIYTGIHDPVVSKELFDRVQEIRLGWKKKPFKYSAKPFAFRGLIKCAHCGCTITCDIKKGKHIYLACTKSKGACEGMRIREEDAMSAVRDVFQSFRIPADVLEAVKNGLKQFNSAKQEFHEQALIRVRREYDRIQKMLKNLMEGRLDENYTG